jgi:hypothetical protein
MDAVVVRASIAALAVAACAPTEPAANAVTPESELALICSIATEVSELPDLDDSRRATEMARRWEREITSARLHAMFDAMAAVPFGERLPIVKRTAAELGVPSWSCPALERYFASPG